MKQLYDILQGLDIRQSIGLDTDKAITDIQFDSRAVRQGSVFIACRGTRVDGHDYIDKAIDNGAAVVVCENLPSNTNAEVTYIQVEDTALSMAIMAENFYDHPSQKLNLIGITGTNGKTTTVTLLQRLFRRLGYHVGLISTIVNKIDEQEIPATHTTPDALELSHLLARMVEAGCKYCFMEVSSHAVVQKRVAGVRFVGGIFSNITHDHLDFHGTMKNYIAAKQSFFTALPSVSWALTNLDDANGMVMVQGSKAKKYTYSLCRDADFHTKIIENTFEGIHLMLGGEDVWCRLVGRFNAYNLTAIYATAMICGEGKEQVLKVMSGLAPAEGRFQYVIGKGITAIVDYAHTPDALRKVLDTIREIRSNGQHITTVVGCGGDRDRTKRPEMAKISAEQSDRLILTSDNPRSEDPVVILGDMKAGLSEVLLAKTIVIADRREAIKTACMLSQRGDIILVAGKGHEKYQEIAGVRHHFDDMEEVSKLLNDKE